MNRLEGIEFRSALEHETVGFLRAVHRGFSEHMKAEPGDLEHYKASRAEMSNSICAFDGDEMIGTSGWLPFDLTVPGGNTDFMAVTDVTVAATHTRRGILTEMMRQLMVKGRDADQHIAGLWASESNIYGRFGFGVSGEGHVAKIDTRHGRFRTMPDISGEVRFADAGKMRMVAPVVWAKATGRYPGMMLRSNADWDHAFDAKRLKRLNNRRPFYVTYTEGDEPLGYVAYRIEHRDDSLHNGNLVRVREFIASTPASEAALWRYLLDIDLASEVYDGHHPKNSTLLWLLADPRKLSLTRYDALMIRILDPVRSLTTRKYAAAGEVAIEVVDEFCPWTAGVYLLSVDGSGEATCELTDRSPDVTMPIASLGSIFMGAHMLSNLARANRVTEHKSGSIALIDTMFPTSGVHNFLPDF